jgi:hypothetical protein
MDLFSNINGIVSKKRQLNDVYLANKLKKKRQFYLWDLAAVRKRGSTAGSQFIGIRNPNVRNDSF